MNWMTSVIFYFSHILETYVMTIRIIKLRKKFSEIDMEKGKLDLYHILWF